MAGIAEELPPEAAMYLEAKKIPQLMEHLYHETLLARPDDPLAFLLHQLASSSEPSSSTQGGIIVPRIIICGPPASGKGTQCEEIVKRYGVVHLSTGDLLREEVRQGTEVGVEASAYMSAGSLVPDALITKLVKERLSDPLVKAKGWLLDGFPRTRSQALSLQLEGIIPNCAIRLDVPDATVTARIAGRLVDPATGHVYHRDYNPPPPGVEVVTRPDDTPAAIAVRLKHYHSHAAQITQCYKSIIKAIDGHKKKEDVFADICAMIDRPLITDY